MKKLNTKKNINKPEIPGKVKKGYRIYASSPTIRASVPTVS